MVTRLTALLRLLFFVAIRIGVTVFLGLNVRNRQLLPQKRPAIIVANHNSHLDTLTLISLFKLRYLPYIRPVAAADYFLKNRYLAWFAKNIIGIIPIERGKSSKDYDPLATCCQAIKEGNIVILFPEGTRGEPEKISQFKKGIAHIAERHPDVPVIPVFIYGLGKSLPKGEFLPVPFFCDIFIGNALYYKGNKREFIDTLTSSFQQLSSEVKWENWE